MMAGGLGQLSEPPALPYDEIGLILSRKDIADIVNYLSRSSNTKEDKEEAKRLIGLAHVRSLDYFVLGPESPYGLLYAGKPKVRDLHLKIVIPYDEGGLETLVELIAKHFTPRTDSTKIVKAKLGGSVILISQTNLQAFLHSHIYISSKAFARAVWGKPKYEYFKIKVEQEMIRLAGLPDEAANHERDDAATDSMFAQDSVADGNDASIPFGDDGERADRAAERHDGRGVNIDHMEPTSHTQSELYEGVCMSLRIHEQTSKVLLQHRGDIAELKTGAKATNKRVTRQLDYLMRVTAPLREQMPMDETATSDLVGEEASSDHRTSPDHQS